MNIYEATLSIDGGNRMNKLFPFNPKTFGFHQNAFVCSINTRTPKSFIPSHNWAKHPLAHSSPATTESYDRRREINFHELKHKNQKQKKNIRKIKINRRLRIDKSLQFLPLICVFVSLLCSIRLRIYLLVVLIS